MPKQPMPLPPLTELRRLFSYDPKSGHIINLISKTSRRAGARAEYTPDAQGYCKVYACGRLYGAHRIAWMLYHGSDPSGFIDHINGDPADNRIENLRVCSHRENMRNQKVRADSETGIKGVHRRKDNGKWAGNISIDGNRLHVGMFDTREEARSAVVSARAALHGDFARHA